MSGSKCRESLIILTNIMYDAQESHLSRKIYSMLLSLVELQKLAYATENERTPRSVLRAYCHAYKFGLVYRDIFSTDHIKKPRTVFGNSFHSLTCHLADTLRIVNGRSIVAEQAERHFNKFRYLLW